MIAHSTRPDDRMIRYALSCDADHGFEAWFGSSDAYDDQAGRGLVECPFCGSHTIRKQIMAPAVTGTRKSTATVDVPAENPDSANVHSSPDTARQMQTMMREAVKAVRSHVSETFDYVGDAFAREARDIHEGRSEKREIYGEATPAEVRKLKDDGVPVAPLPPDPAKAN